MTEVTAGRFQGLSQVLSQGLSQGLSRELLEGLSEHALAGAPHEQDWRHTRLRACLEQGLPLVPEPFKALAEETGLSVGEVRALIGYWQHSGLIKRVGLVVRPRSLGLTANAMVVWNLPDEGVDEVGRRLASEPQVTLCYQRLRRPDWPYNLYCMLHGVRRERVEAQISALIQRHALEHVEHQVLFSRRAYCQRGGRFTPEMP